MSALECWWAPMVPRHHAHNCSWALMSAHCSMAPSSGVFMAAQESLWASISTHEHQLALISTHRQQRETMSTPDYQWTHLSSHWHSWAWHHGAMSTNESTREVMSMAPWSHGSLSALKSTHGAIARYLCVLVRAHVCTWVLMKAHEHSWDLMSAEVLH